MEREKEGKGEGKKRGGRGEWRKGASLGLERVGKERRGKGGVCVSTYLHMCVVEVLGETEKK